MKKIVSFILALGLALVMAACFTGCAYEQTGTQRDTSATLEVGSKLASNQPTPTDIDYSLERYNLIKRAYWVNGQREKANTLPCAVAKPLGYIVLFTDNGAVVGSFVVDGKVSSLNSFLTPDSEYCELVYGGTSSYTNDWLPDVDGSYGTNDNGIFFFDVQGNYIEWTGTYIYTDIPMEIKNPVINFEVTYE